MAFESRSIDDGILGYVGDDGEIRATITELTPTHFLLKWLGYTTEYVSLESAKAAGEEWADGAERSWAYMRDAMAEARALVKADPSLAAIATACIR